MIVVDASAWIDYFIGPRNAETEALDAILGTERVVVGDLTIAEVLAGFRNDRDFRTARRLLETCELRPMVGHENAVRAAARFRALRKAGVTVRKTIDVLIGTFCIVNRLPLLHRDRDFDPMEERLGLKVWRRQA
jgi:predicted nucleic acid-binding protein